MATPAPRKRKAAAPQVERTVKTSLTLGVELHTKLAAAAAMACMDRNAYVVGVLEAALGGIVVFDRRKSADRLRTVDRPSDGDDVNSDVEDEAA